MKILLVHPDDSVDLGPWTKNRWDLAFDLGWSGRHAYSRQTERMGFPVSSIYDLLDHETHRLRMREVLSLGLGQLVDSESVDWWDVLSSFFYAQLEEILLVSALAERIPDKAEVFTTRPHAAVPALSQLLDGRTKREIKSFSASPQTGVGDKFRRYLKAASALRVEQISEIAFDKWDTDYRLRRNLHRPPRTSSTPAILLPSAYSNVSRSEIAYAKMLSHRRFLLVITRPNGRLPMLPDNVELRWLAAYTPRSLAATAKETDRLIALFQQMQNNRFEANCFLRLAIKLHVFARFARMLRTGLRIRDAWREVLIREPLTAVLSADENNPFTRLPTVLAQSRKLHTVFCEHGALNMTFGIRPLVSHRYLLRGDMARDYCTEWCGMSADKIIVGAPAESPNSVPPSTFESANPTNATQKERKKDQIVFYSEAYELYSGRTATFYAELLPELCLLAQKMNCKVIVKLHPFESFRMRTAIINQAISAEQRNLVELREGPMTPDLFERAYCSLTLESTVAVESTAHGVPCFLCTWFDASWYDYAKQFAKFSAGYPLDSPQKIREIPQLLGQIRITEEIRQRLQRPITPEHLESVLSGS
jgi:hypothetical protein